MYKFDHNRQYTLDDFDQPIGLKMGPNNRWAKEAATIPWDDIEERYAELFPSDTRIPAKQLLTAFGSMLIQKQVGFSDREPVEEIAENPYFQYFKKPFAPSFLAEFRKRLDEDALAEINEMIIEYNKPDDPNSDGSSSGGDSTGQGNSVIGVSDNTESGTESAKNNGTLILNATCATSYIAYPQDINLLNEARVDLEEMIDTICEANHVKKSRAFTGTKHSWNI